MAESLSLHRCEGAHGVGGKVAKSQTDRAKWVPWVHEGPAGRQGSKAALDQPVGAVQPYDGHLALLPLPALLGHFHCHSHHPLEHLGMTSVRSHTSSSELLWPPGVARSLCLSLVLCVLITDCFDPKDDKVSCYIPCISIQPCRSVSTQLQLQEEQFLCSCILLASLSPPMRFWAPLYIFCIAVLPPLPA